MATLASLSIDLIANSAQLVKEVKKANKSIDGMAKTARMVSGVMKVAIGAVSVRALADMGREAIQAADEMGKLAGRLGATVEGISELAYVAQLSGVEVRSMNMGLQRMTRRVSEAAKGTGEAQAALAELGINAKALNQLKPEDQFEVLAQAISETATQADRVRLAMKLFDSEGVKLVQTMGDGARGIREMREEARKMGATISGDTAQKAAQFNDDLLRMETSLKAVARSIAIDVADAFSGLDKMFTDFVGSEDTIEGLEKKITRAAEAWERAKKGYGLSLSGAEAEAALAEFTRLSDKLEEMRAAQESEPLLITITGGADAMQEHLETTRSALEELLMTNKDYLIEELAQLEQHYFDNKLPMDELYWSKKNEIRMKYASKELKDMTKLNKQEEASIRASFSRQLSAAAGFSKAFAAIHKANAIFEVAINAKKAAVAAEAWGTAIGGPALGKVFKAISYASTAAEIASIAGLSYGGGGGGGGSASPTSPEVDLPANDIDTGGDEARTKTVYFNVEGIGDAELLPKSMVRNLVDLINEENESNVRVII